MKDFIDDAAIRDKDKAQSVLPDRGALNGYDAVEQRSFSICTLFVSSFSYCFCPPD